VTFVQLFITTMIFKGQRSHAFQIRQPDKKMIKINLFLTEMAIGLLIKHFGSVILQCQFLYYEN